MKTNTTTLTPELLHKMDAIAVRVPIPDGALTDIVAHLKKDVSVERVNAAFQAAAEGANAVRIPMPMMELGSTALFGR